MKSDSQSSNKTTAHQVIHAMIWMPIMQRKMRKVVPSKNQFTRKQLYNYFKNDKNIIMLLKYIKQRNFHGLKEKPGLSLIIKRYLENFLKTTEKAKAGPQERFRMSKPNIFSFKWYIRIIIIQKSLKFNKIGVQYWC